MKTFSRRSSLSSLIHPSSILLLLLLLYFFPAAAARHISSFSLEAQLYDCLLQGRLLHEPGVHVLLLLERVQSWKNRKRVGESEIKFLPSLLRDEGLQSFGRTRAGTHTFLLNPPKAGYAHTQTHTLFLYIREYFCQVGKWQKLGSEAWLVSAGECKSLKRTRKSKNMTLDCAGVSFPQCTHTHTQSQGKKKESAADPDIAYFDSLIPTCG